MQSPFVGMQPAPSSAPFIYEGDSLLKWGSKNRFVLNNIITQPSKGEGVGEAEYIKGIAKNRENNLDSLTPR